MVIVSGVAFTGALLRRAGSSPSDTDATPVPAAMSFSFTCPPSLQHPNRITIWVDRVKRKRYIPIKVKVAAAMPG